MLLLFWGIASHGQTDSLIHNADSLNAVTVREYHQKLAEAEEQRIADSIKKAELESKLAALQTADNLDKEGLLQQLKAIEANEQKRLERKKARIDSLRNTAVGYPVTGILKDTLFLLYSKIGAATPEERARSISGKIERLYGDDLLNTDSLQVLKSENTYDIVYGDLIVMSISESDGIWYGKDMPELAQSFKESITNSLVQAREQSSVLKLILRIGLVLLVIAVSWGIIWLIGKAIRGFCRLLTRTETNG